MSSNQSHERLYLGVDGGGSKCRVRLEGKGSTTHAITGPANPFQDTAEAKKSMVSAAQLALAEAGLGSEYLGELIVGAGLAGNNVPASLQALSGWDHPFGALHLTTDIHVACLGAHGLDNGAVIIAGTGTVGYAQTNDSSTMLGAHGFPHGDRGSGAWLGLEAVKAALLASDDLGPPTQLLASLEAKLERTGIGVVEALHLAKSRDYARLAPLVFDASEEGDAVAGALINEAADYLNRMADKLFRSGANQLSLIGGLASRITPYLASAVVSRIVDPRDPPESGAILFARQCEGELEGVVRRVV